MTGWEWTFWVSALYIFYTYLGYPLLLLAWRATRGGKREAAGSAPPEGRPTVSVILTARNEVENIGPKLEDLLAQDYPKQLLEIWVASDQSTDGTNDVVRRYQEQDSRIRLAAYEENIGKSVAINRTAPLTSGEVLLLSDVRQRVDPDAVSRMARHFANPEVAIVGAEMTLVDGSGRASCECTGLYWRYERQVRKLESDLDLLAGVSGAFFAVRKSCFRDIPPGSYCEDVTLALYARRENQKVLWEPGACIYERMRDPYTEFRRKVRTLVGNYQLLSQFWPLYLPWRGRLAFTLLSHKVCRLFIPVALAVLLFASVVCAGGSFQPFYLAALVGQVLFYSAGLLALLRAETRRSRLVNACGAFCMLNWAALVALFHVMRHGPRIQWR